jgi:hypothetical protein
MGIGTQNDLAIPARHKAILGDLAGSGIFIDCHEIRPRLVHENLTYEYCGTSDGIAIYKIPDDLRELGAELEAQR